MYVHKTEPESKQLSLTHHYQVENLEHVGKISLGLPDRPQPIPVLVQCLITIKYISSFNH